jgi:hypothetical protein
MFDLIKAFFRGLRANFKITVSHLYEVECYAPDGSLKWRDCFENLVTTEGLNKYLDATLKTGLASPAWYVLLKGTGAAAAGDTLASHAAWAEITAYSGDRKALTLGTISGGSVDNSASKASFAITGTATVAGAGVCSAATGTSGTLLGVGDFSASKGVASGDTLNVTVTCSMTSA